MLGIGIGLEILIPDDFKNPRARFITDIRAVVENP
jgi:hypothetical protein